MSIFAKTNTSVIDHKSLDHKSLDHLVERAAEQTGHAIDATTQAVSGAFDALQNGVDHLRTDMPGAMTRAAAQVDELSHRGLKLARQTSADVREQVGRAGDRTVHYIQDQPVKSVLIAVAAGAALAAVVGLVARTGSQSGSDRR